MPGFTPIGSPLKTRAFLVYDLEWRPDTFELTCAGVFDGEKYHVRYTIADLLDVLFTKENRHKWMYAHYGGMADMVFLLQEIVKDDRYELEATFSGSSAVMVRVRRGRDSWVLLDSYWLLRDKLAHLAHSIGERKGTDAWHCRDYPACGHAKPECYCKGSEGCKPGDEAICMYFTAPPAVLRQYNEDDCRILYKAIDLFQKELNHLGGDLQVTIASTAMRLFRRKYLKSEIKTSPLLSDLTRQSYIASRVEVVTKVGVGITEWDINSSFPSSMTSPTPGSFLGRAKHLPRQKESLCFFARARVKVPPMFLPPLGRKAKRDGRVYFPYGEWEGLFAEPDLELLETAGGSILDVKEVLLYESRTDFSDYASELYNLRKTEKNPFRRILIKFLMNACYGKTAESREKQRFQLHPSSLLCPHHGEHDVVGSDGVKVAECVEEIFPGAILISETKEVAHEHVPIASYITSRSRSALWKFARQADRDLFYMDTDSIWTHHQYEGSKELGGLKKEKTVRKVEFQASKLYRITLDDGSVKVKGKGFSRLSSEQFDALVVGDPVPVERFMRLKEMLRSRDIRARNIQTTKQLRLGHVRPKRQFHADGTTEPWHVAETEARFRPLKGRGRAQTAQAAGASPAGRPVGGVHEASLQECEAFPASPQGTLAAEATS